MAVPQIMWVSREGVVSEEFWETETALADGEEAQKKSCLLLRGKGRTTTGEWGSAERQNLDGGGSHGWRPDRSKIASKKIERKKGIGVETRT